MIRKAVLPVAGLGTRLLPMTKEMPKEMLPIFLRSVNGKICLKPMIQAIFEQLYDAGFREFCFIVGRGKRVIEDHFTPDYDFVKYLRSKKRVKKAEELETFYRKINDSTIVLINQPEPLGFGDAVYRAKAFTNNEPFLMHAGDDMILSSKNNHIKRIRRIFEEYSADICFFVEEVNDPRRYGVMIGEEIKPNLFRVSRIIEKPEVPPTNLAIIALYIFKPIIYEAIENVEPDERGEIQLANAINIAIEKGCKVYALKLERRERRIDIGTPEAYLEILMSII